MSLSAMCCLLEKAVVCHTMWAQDSMVRLATRLTRLQFRAPRFRGPMGRIDRLIYLGLPMFNLAILKLIPCNCTELVTVSLSCKQLHF